MIEAGVGGKKLSIVLKMMIVGMMNWNYLPWDDGFIYTFSTSPYLTCLFDGR